MAAFVKGDLQVLLATEAAGMGCDISDVVQVIQYGHPRDLPSFVQRIGRAARDRKIHGFGVLYVPPITQHAADPLVREFIEKRDGTCLWAFIDKLFDFKDRTCNNSCSVCSPQERTRTTTICRDTPSKNNAKRWPARTKEEKYEALQRLKAWREKAYKTWVSSRPFMTSCESWIMSDEFAMQLSEKLSRFRTAEDVKSFASSCGWTPAGGNTWWVGIAEVLCKLNDEIVAGHGPGSETTAASVLAQPEDGSGGDGELNGEENALE
ncbi:ATP-dependent DNA helicase sgs1 [Podila clonocystis]|nr:ATP-dependent DNA helicase sgs1 [Podila clonocystis]